MGSLVGQDWCKLLIMGTIVGGVLVNSVSVLGTTTKESKAGIETTIPERRVTSEDSFVGRLFNPQKEDVKIVREMEPAEAGK